MGLEKRLIPQILIRDGLSVKGKQFRNHRTVGNPVSQARIYASQGAQEVMMLETGSDYEGLLKLVGALGGELECPLVAGGGINTVERACETVRAGADGVAIREPPVNLCREIADKLGRQAITAVVNHHGITTQDGGHLPTVLKTLQDEVGEILLTDMDREGTGRGLNLPIAGVAAWSVGCPLVVAGGAKDAADVRQGLLVCHGVAVGRLLAFTSYNLPQLTAACYSGNPGPS